MANYYGSLYEGGRWEWDDAKRGLVFISSVAVSKKKQTEKHVEVQPKNLRVYLDMHFADTMDPKEVATFRRLFYRRVGASDVDVVCLQDVRDVVMYQCSSMLPVDIIDLLHLEVVERFVRALILYMQFFLEVMEALHERSRDREQRLTLGDLTNLEREWQRDLNDLRTLVAREHCNMLMAADPSMRHYHHMGGGGTASTGSQGERDIRFYEILWRFTARMVFVALFRRSFSLIEAEMNRLFRSPAFSAHLKRKTRGSKAPAFEVPTTPRRSVALAATANRPNTYEYRTLYGEGREERRIFNTRSPATRAALADSDYRLMATGNIDFVGQDARLLKLWYAMTLPEEMLASHDIVLGILGLPRAAFDPMLTPLNKLTVEEDKDEIDLLGASTAMMPSAVNLDDQGGGGPQLLGTHPQERMEIPPPGPRVPAPAVFPAQRAHMGLLNRDVGSHAQTIMALKEARDKDRAKLRQRWCRWEAADGRARRRQSTPNALAEAAAQATAQALTDDAVEIAEELLGEMGSSGEAGGSGIEESVLNSITGTSRSSSTNAVKRKTQRSMRHSSDLGGDEISLPSDNQEQLSDIVEEDD